jgi:hypothetical protein
MSVFDHADVAEMTESRARIGRINVRIHDWPLRRRSWRYHPFSASNLGFQKSIAENRHDRDRIEDEDEQHHGVGHGGINPVIRDGYHDLEAHPVQQRRCPVELCIAWPPEPIGSERRWRLWECLVHLVVLINVLHVQSLSTWKNSTGPSDLKPGRHDHRGPIADGNLACSSLPSSFPPPLHRALPFGSEKWAYFGSSRRPR